MQGRVRFAAANIFALPLEFKREFDCVLINPPFHGEGQASPDAGRARALMDEGALGDWLEAGLKRAISGGTLTAILRADRLNEALAALPRTGVSALPLWPKAGEPARRVLVQARKGSDAAFCLLPGLTLHDNSGAYTQRSGCDIAGASRACPGGTPSVGSGPSRRLPNSCPDPSQAKTLSGPDPDLAGFLGVQGLPDPAALRQ